MAQNNVKTEGWKREVKEETEKVRLVHFVENYKLFVFIFYMYATLIFCMTQCRLTSFKIQKNKTKSCGKTLNETRS
jgi:hypothetical protein